MLNVINQHLDRHDKLLRHGLLVFMSAIIAGGLNYGFQLYMMRALPADNYGALASLFSLVYLVLFGLQSISSVTSKLVSEYKSRGELEKAGAMINFLFERLIVVGLVVCFLVIVFRNIISDFLHLPDSRIVFLLALVLMVAFVSPLITGALNGMQQFFWSGASSVTGAFFKISFGAFLVYLGFGIYGALLALAIGMVVPVVMFLLILRSKVPSSIEKFDYVQFMGFAAPAMAMVTTLALISNIDIILVRHKFSGADSGMYAAMSTLAKFIWFLCVPLTIVMLPKVNEIVGRAILRKTLCIIALIGCSIVTVFFVFGSFFTHLIYGANSLLLVAFGISMTLFSLVDALVVFNLALRRLRMAYIVAAALIIEFILIVFFSTEIAHVIFILLFTNLMLLVSMLYYTRGHLVSSDTRSEVVANA